MDEKFWDFNNKANIHFDIIHRVGILYLMFTVTEKKIDEFSGEIKWYDKEDSRSNNKFRMKEAGRMINGYNQSLRELLIIGLAKALEDLFFDIEDKLNLKIDFWKDCDNFTFYEEMKIIRHLNNCIKHNKGILKKGNRSSNYLVNKAGFNEYSQIGHLTLDIEKFIMQSFTFQMDLFWKLTERENPYIEIKDDFNRIKNIILPNFMT